ncbi:DMT family transporter [Pseudomonadota bacterium]
MRIFALRKKEEPLDHAQGITLYLICCSISSTLTILLKYLAEDISVFQITVIRGLFALMFFIPIIIKTRARILVTPNPKINLFCGTVTFISIILWLKAISMISAPDATATSFVTPILTTLVAMFILKEKVTRHQWISIMAGFIGMLFIIRPCFDGGSDLGYFLIIIAGFFTATSNILVKKMTKNQVPGTIVIYNIFLSVIFAFPFMMMDYKPIGLNQVFILALVGFLISLFYLTKTMAFDKTNVSVVQPFDFLKLIFTATLSYFVFDQFVDLHTAIGALIIVIATSYELRKTRKEKRRREKEKAKKALVTKHI